jgi:hypothetical protein
MSLPTVQYKILSAAVTASVASLVLSTVEGLEVGATSLVQGTGQARLDQRHTNLTVNTTTKTVTFTAAGANITLFEPANAELTPLCTWTNAEQVAIFLGFEPDPASNDEAYLELVVEAANDFAYRRREQAGYNDSRVLVPNVSAPQGTVLYAAALFRERGSVDSFASFQDINIQPMVGSMGQILRLLGVPRPAVA